MTLETPSPPDDGTVKSNLKRQIKADVTSFKHLKIDTHSFMEVVNTEVANAVCQCLKREDLSPWKYMRQRVKIIGELLQ